MIYIFLVYFFKVQNNLYCIFVYTSSDTFKYSVKWSPKTTRLILYKLILQLRVQNDLKYKTKKKKVPRKGAKVNCFTFYFILTDIISLGVFLHILY